MLRKDLVLRARQKQQHLIKLAGSAEEFNKHKRQRTRAFAASYVLTVRLPCIHEMQIYFSRIHDELSKKDKGDTLYNTLILLRL